MKAWTDYPFVELGDAPGVEAPIRRIDVLSYDRDKYCYIVVNGIVSNIKRGYIYQKAGRCGEVPTVDETCLFFLPEDIEHDDDV